MKRLITNKLHNSFKNKDSENFECFKNPTMSEFKIIEDNDPSELGNVRGIIDNNSNFYIWDGSIDHWAAIDPFKIPDGIHVNIENGNIDYFSSKTQTEYTVEEMQDKIKNCQSFLDIFDLNTPLLHYYTKDRNSYDNKIPGDIKTLGNFLNYIPVQNELEKVNRLINSEIFTGFTGLSGKYYECYINPSYKNWLDI